MHSVRVQLSVLFLIVTTITLAAFGVYDYFQLSKELNANFVQLQKGTTTRLSISLPSPIWSFNLDAVGSIIKAEMLPEEVLAIDVFDENSGFLFGSARDDQKRIVTRSQASRLHGISVGADLFRSNTDVGGDKKLASPNSAIGRVVVYFSRDRIDEILKANVIRRIVEALVIDVMLVIVLSLSLRMVFTPLRRLREALFELAHQDGDDVEELPETQKNEFGDVVKGFNQTQRKFKHVIEKLRQAEEAMQSEASKTRQAYLDLKAAQQSMLQSEKLASLGSLVAGVAHEINTPVGITLTSASTLLDATERLRNAMTDGAMKKSEIMAYIASASEGSRLIMKNAERAAHLIQSFKQVAADQTSEQRRKYELKEYIEEVMSSLHPKFKKAQGQPPVQVTVSCPELIELDGYPGAMAQVLTNLTLNALTHAFKESEQGEIEITAERSSEWVILKFSDNGCGISTANLGKIFDPFFTTNRDRGGTGLGLNIVYNIVNKQFGGTIAVQSEVGKGTCFTLKFPRNTLDASSLK
jgi:signal transduction histidine kinase